MLLIASPLIEYVKSEIKKEIRIKISKKSFSESEISRFKLKDLQEAVWEGTDEFYLDNSMYDVIEFKTINGDEYVFCLKDKKESLVQPIKNFANFLFKKNNDKFCFSKEKFRTPSSFKILYQQEKDIFILDNLLIDVLEVFFMKITHCFYFVQEIFSPPKNYYFIRF